MAEPFNAIALRHGGDFLADASIARRLLAAGQGDVGSTRRRDFDDGDAQGLTVILADVFA